jgi:spore coat protein CotH
VDRIDEFFANGVIPTLRIEIGPKEMDALGRDPRAYVRGTLKELEPGKPDRVYPNVAVHLKGTAGSFRGVGDRPAFTLSFERYPGSKEFHGLSKLHLNNSVQDPTYVSENLGRTFFRAAGIPAARSSHARVWLNDRDMGFYVLLEGLDRAFLQRSYGVRGGIVFESNVQEIVQPLNATIVERSSATTQPQEDSPEAKKLEAEAKQKARGELKRLLAAANERDPAVRRKKLEEVLDVDRFFTFMAMETLLVGADQALRDEDTRRAEQMLEAVNASLDYFSGKTAAPYGETGSLAEQLFRVGIPYMKETGTRP